MSLPENQIGLHFCSVCQYSLNSDAELAIHEFSKRHCDNLLRQSKNKPAKPKVPKTTPAREDKPTEKEQVINQPGNFALYGYFNPGEIIDTQPKEFNVEYDPYLQKLAENPYKETTFEETPMVPTTNVTSFSKSKKRKKRSCQICNVTLMNIPEYEAHMKSPQHAWKLKVSGMGVSAHFVKASTDLHTTDHVDEPAENVSVIGPRKAPVPIAPAELFCDVCEILLNSQIQYDAHLTGRAHLDNVQRKVKKDKNVTPVPNQLFCYTCRLSLNNLNQYNDHKNGKKHKIKCRQLIREGITIPPEERPADMTWSCNTTMAVVYPPLYEQQVQKKTIGPTKPPEMCSPPVNPVVNPVPNLMTGMYHCSQCSERFGTASKLTIHLKTHPNTKPSTITALPSASSTRITFYNNAKPATEVANVSEKTVAPVAASDFNCSLCDVKFLNQPPFETHLNSETHALKIFELKKNGMSSKDLLSKVMADRKVIRPDKHGRHCCGICAVMSQNTSEVTQHLQSLLHKYAEKDYTKKRMMEIQQSVEAGEDGVFNCRLCKESWPKLTLYNAHLHTPSHRSIFWKEHIKKNYIRRWLNIRSGNRFRPKAKEDEKNPGVRTKVGGISTDLNSGVIETVPNLEPIEPKIDIAKNVELGVSVCKTGSVKKRRLMPARRLPGMVYRRLPAGVARRASNCPEEPNPMMVAPPRPVPPPMRPRFLAPRMVPPRQPRFHPYPHPQQRMPYRWPPFRPYRQPLVRPMSRWRQPYPEPSFHDTWEWY